MNKLDNKLSFFIFGKEVAINFNTKQVEIQSKDINVIGKISIYLCAEGFMDDNYLNQMRDKH
jgi:hypothetical protein